ncbi:hypothetical protein CGRA01v4_14317 [Colletotrichum graminicola]|uniref:Uncharacterized protein n=1 Tax=Colletotrichum graminicola (strain M1.001 / M2 / FGSC 10212) TaxID=645133 RepID=E3Q5E4_COLGM|nr:uncharacterized protein GLRG_01055 [Colletotrichum graminicola M1.001]EFQ25911.1 hypothetical protein GLRG_01055 [Colletotrichum graminicola M1.001]WDK23026.1 hypothetical protein CGRA01v4_14317 [Colletotrichum graminicola]
MASHNTNYSDIKASAKENAAGVYAYSQRQIDRVVSQDTRQKAYDSAYNLAQDQPFLFAFLLVQLIFSFLPTLVFVSFAFSTVAFAFGVAVVFSLFWISIALLVLVPTLFFTCSIAVLVWVWAAGSFVVAKRLYEISPIRATGDLEMHVPNGKTYAVTKHEDGVDVHPHN